MQASQIQHILIVEALITNRHNLQVDILAQINSFICSITLVIANCNYFHIQRNRSNTPTLISSNWIQGGSRSNSRRGNSRRSNSRRSNSSGGHSSRSNSGRNNSRRHNSRRSNSRSHTRRSRTRRNNRRNNTCRGNHIHLHILPQLLLQVLHQLHHGTHASHHHSVQTLQTLP